ncbi:hypothetical protein [Pseudophaeobacter sp.]|uniref:hypothetical protein n=1 Tax=Pseudophaeobacter sp. TaxID=1971739 RepID=UPI0032977D08
MFARITGAATRGILVALLIAMPSMLLPVSATESPEIIALMAILGGVLTFAEYFSNYPSFVEFREAPPLNRMRYVAAFVMIGALSLLVRHSMDPTGLTTLVQTYGTRLGAALDFAYSPVQLTVLMLPTETPTDSLQMVRSAAGIAYVVSALAIFGFILAIRIGNWPVANGAFNVWVNLPLFDPTTGGDVVTRLQRDGRINIILGILLPFAIPATIKLASGLIDVSHLTAPPMLIWVIAAWAFVPASMIMRGLAMLRVADLIAQKRRAVYAHAEALQAA